MSLGKTADNYSPARVKRWKDSAFENPVTQNMGSFATDDDDSNAMAASHAYLANQDGNVTVYLAE